MDENRAHQRALEPTDPVRATGQWAASATGCDCYELNGGLGPHDADCPIYDGPQPPYPDWRAMGAAEQRARETGSQATVTQPAGQQPPGWQADADSWGTGTGISAAEMEREA